MDEALLFRDECYRIVGAAMEVQNSMGHGFHEKPYENALVIELRALRFRVEQQCAFPITYKGEVVGEYIPDIVVDRKMVVETKTVESIGNAERSQMLNYLNGTEYRLGIIVNFRNPKLEWERIVR